MFLLLFFFWLLLCGKLTAEIAVIGLLVCGGVYALACKTLGFSFRGELRLWRKAPLALLYLIKLIGHVLVAGVQTMALTLSPRAKEVKPRLVYIKKPVATKLGEVILANSITLTPGTISCGVGEDMMCIHALDEPFAHGLDSSAFVRDIRKMEGADR